MTVQPIMRGVEYIRQAIATYLSTALPYYVEVARRQWGLTDFDLPLPLEYNAYDPTLASQFPAIGSFATNDREHKRNDYTAEGAQEYQAIYSMRILTIARTPQDEAGNWMEPQKQQAVRLRDDLTSLVRAALLQTPSLGNENLAMEENSMTTDYLEPMQPNTQSKRWVAASVISLDFQLSEWTYALPYGAANAITTTVSKLTP